MKIYPMKTKRSQSSKCEPFYIYIYWIWIHHWDLLPWICNLTTSTTIWRNMNGSRGLSISKTLWNLQSILLSIHTPICSCLKVLSNLQSNHQSIRVLARHMKPTQLGHFPVAAELAELVELETQRPWKKNAASINKVRRDRWISSDDIHTIYIYYNIINIVIYIYIYILHYVHYIILYVYYNIKYIYI
jgi:hypothetical protein